MIFFFLLLAAMIVALVAQFFIPEIPICGARVLLMPLIMFYGALALPTPGMLVLAFCGGLMWDALHVQMIEGNVEVALGWSIVLYATLGALMGGFRPLFQRGRWEIHCLLSGVCTALIVLAEYLMITFRREPVVFVFSTDESGGGSAARALVAALLPPLFFFALQLRSPSRLATIRNRIAASATATVEYGQSSFSRIASDRSRVLHFRRPGHPRGQALVGAGNHSGKSTSSKISGRSEITVRIPSVRGEIRDRNGITLVANRASYEVDFYLPDMVRGYRQEFGKPPVVEYTANARQMRKKLKEPDMVKIVNDSVIPRLQELNLAKDYNSEHLQKHYRNDTLVPFT